MIEGVKIIPLKVFSDIYSYDKNKDFTLIALMLKNKFDSFPKKDIELCKDVPFLIKRGDLTTSLTDD